MTETKLIPVRPIRGDVPMDPRYSKRPVEPAEFEKLVDAPMEQPVR